jgi:hypothetical protein
MPRRGGVTDHNAAMNYKAETNMATHQGHCFCGAVEIEVNGAPEAMGYCHCNACRSWSAAPVNAFSLWKPKTSVAFTPALHVNYAETVLPIRDGLPKLKDFPAEMGGSGTVLPE